MVRRGYNPPDSDYSETCRQGCDDEIYTCKLCGHKGHRTVYKHDDENMVPVIEHAHFLSNKDKGRNKNCKIGEPVYCPKEMRVYGWRLYQGQDRWLKIPKNQKRAMGWEE